MLLLPPNTHTLYITQFSPGSNNSCHTALSHGLLFFAGESDILCTLMLTGGNYQLLSLAYIVVINKSATVDANSVQYDGYGRANTVAIYTIDISNNRIFHMAPKKH